MKRFLKAKRNRQLGDCLRILSTFDIDTTEVKCQLNEKGGMEFYVMIPDFVDDETAEKIHERFEILAETSESFDDGYSDVMNGDGCDESRYDDDDEYALGVDLANAELELEE